MDERTRSVFTLLSGKTGSALVFLVNCRSRRRSRVQPMHPGNHARHSDRTSVGGVDHCITRGDRASPRAAFPPAIRKLGKTFSKHTVILSDIDTQ
jgi:hypothetical protein